MLSLKTLFGMVILYKDERDLNENDSLFVFFTLLARKVLEKMIRLSSTNLFMLEYDGSSVSTRHPMSDNK